MTKELIALGLLLGVHILGAGVLVWMLALSGRGDGAGGLWGEDRGWDGWEEWDEPRPSAPSEGIPLPDAEQSPARLREPGRLRDRWVPAPRRPAHAPAPAPARQDPATSPRSSSSSSA